MVAESQLQHQALAGAAFSELHQCLLRVNAQSAANQDQVFQLNLGIRVAGAKRFVRSAQAVNEVQRYEFRQGRRVRLDRNAKNAAERHESSALGARLRRGEECPERPTSRSARPLFALHANTAANRSQPADRQTGQASDDLRPNAMRYQAARRFGAPVLLQQHIVPGVRAQVSPLFVRNARPQGRVLDRQFAPFIPKGDRANVDDEEKETITAKHIASADAVGRSGGVGLDAAPEYTMFWPGR
jgi:hypothetical protein